MIKKHKEVNDEAEQVHLDNHLFGEASDRLGSSRVTNGSWKEDLGEDGPAFHVHSTRELMPQRFSRLQSNDDEMPNLYKDKEVTALPVDLSGKACESTNKLNIDSEDSLLSEIEHGKLKATRRAFKPYRRCIVEVEMELAAAKHEGFVGSYSSETNGTNNRRRLMAVIGVITEFGRKNNRDVIRRSWLPSGPALKKLEEEKGVLVRFVIGRSANRGDSLDMAIDEENMHTKDFFILDNHIEPSGERPKKTKLFFAHAADTWDAEFYAKVNDDVYVNIDALGAMLATHWDKPRFYMGCMKSGEVFSQSNDKWYEPDWWKFGDGRSYFRHASGEIFVISRALAQFISINRAILRTYAHDDVSVGSWMVGLDVKHINEGKFCCSSSWSSGAICTAVR